MLHQSELERSSNTDDFITTRYDPGNRSMTTATSPPVAVSACDPTLEMNLEDTNYRLADMFILFVASVVAQVFLYGFIVRRLWRHSSAIGSSVLLTHRTRHMAKFCIPVLTFYCVFCFPWFLSNLVLDAIERKLPAYVDARDQYGINISLNVGRRLLLTLALCYSWITPVTYTIFKEKIQKTIVEMMRCQRCRPTRVQPTIAVAFVAAGAKN